MSYYQSNDNYKLTKSDAVQLFDELFSKYMKSYSDDLNIHLAEKFNELTQLLSKKEHFEQPVNTTPSDDYIVIKKQDIYMITIFILFAIVLFLLLQPKKSKSRFY